MQGYWVHVRGHPAFTLSETGGRYTVTRKANVRGRILETAVLQTTDTDSLALLEEETPEEGVTEVSTEKKSSVSAADNNPEQLLQQGFSFLSGLARTLSSPEATQRLVDSIVEEDKETGRTSIRIPVSDKESVAGILNLFGKLLAAGNKT